MTDLRVEPCSYTAARHAVMNWHYSVRMPMPPLVRFGAWEDDEFIGAIVFGRGPTPHLLRPFGLDLVEGAELARVALRDHVAPVSQIASRAIKLLKATNPGLRLLVSYADPAHGHHGGIYQAMNWTYTGMTKASRMHRDEHGGLRHNRSIKGSSGMFGPRRGHGLTCTTPVRMPPKHRYVLPLDRAMARQIAPLARRYPSPCNPSQGLEHDPGCSARG